MMYRNHKVSEMLIAERGKALKRWSFSVWMILVVALPGTAATQPTEETISAKKEATERTVELQAITTLSSMQLYTQFALVRNMLQGDWDEEVFKQFSFYDGINLQMMRRYEKKLRGDTKWGPAFKVKNSIHEQVYDDLEPLIRKRRKNQKLTAADLVKLKDLNKLIFEKLIQ